MFDSSIWGLLVALIVLSPIALPFLKDGKCDERSLMISGCVAFFALSMPFFGFGSFAVVWKFMLAQTLLFASFVCVSRIRQRKSLFLQALAGAASNGGWFLAMQVLAGAYLAQKQGIANAESVGLLVAAICGTLVGRLAGVQWMMWVEKRWQVRTDSVGSSSLRWFDERTQSALLWIFCTTFAVYFTAALVFKAVSLSDVIVVMVLGFLQSQIYTVNARFANRDHPGWSIVSGLVAGTIFMVHWAYLIGYTQTGGFMPLSLLVPYLVATVYGSNSGAILSMMLERVLNIHADTHAKGALVKDLYKDVTWHTKVLVAVAIVGGAHLVFSGHVFALMGIAPNTVVLPFTVFAGTGLERPLSLLIGGLVFFANNLTHTLSSRAGNRNHAPYHAITCVLHGIVTFGTGTFVILNASMLDLIPVAAFGSAAGQLFAQRWSMKMESWLVAVMDVPEEKKSQPKAA